MGVVGSIDGEGEESIFASKYKFQTLNWTAIMYFFPVLDPGGVSMPMIKITIESPVESLSSPSESPNEHHKQQSMN